MGSDGIVSNWNPHDEASSIQGMIQLPRPYPHFHPFAEKYIRNRQTAWVMISPSIVNPMGRIVDLQELERFLPGKSNGKIVLTGGSFDILHIGHVKFLSEAKGAGDYLIILLESDQKVKKLKGSNRPVFIQRERAEMLAALASVDLIVLIPMMENDADYLNLVTKIKPDIIAVTENDPQIENRRRHAKEVGGELKIIPLTKTFSTSKLAKIIGVE
jgi:D-beta-D-heptose 7-phosphate kinase/D-beta-D-heptose 1-phosphate adenosyltransferase